MLEECINYSVKRYKKIEYQYYSEIMNKIKSIDYPVSYQMTGILLGIFNCENVSDEDIRSISNDEVLGCLKILNSNSDNQYEYIKKIIINDITRVVKVAECLVSMRHLMHRRRDEIEKNYEMLNDFYPLAMGTMFENEFTDSLLILEKKIQSRIL